MFELGAVARWHAKPAAKFVVSMDSKSGNQEHRGVIAVTTLLKAWRKRCATSPMVADQHPKEG